MTEGIKKKLAFLKAAEYKDLRRLPKDMDIIFPDETSEIYINTYILNI